MFHIPMSSPMMKTMFGLLLSAACAGAPTPTANPKASASSISFGICFTVLSFCLGLVATRRPLRTDHRCFHCFLFFFSKHARPTTLGPASETFGKITLSLIARGRTNETLVLQLCSGGAHDEPLSALRKKCNDRFCLLVF